MVAPSVTARQNRFHQSQGLPCGMWRTPRAPPDRGPRPNPVQPDRAARSAGCSWPISPTSDQRRVGQMQRVDGAQCQAPASRRQRIQRVGGTNHAVDRYRGLAVGPLHIHRSITVRCVAAMRGAQGALPSSRSKWFTITSTDAGSSPSASSVGRWTSFPADRVHRIGAVGGPRRTVDARDLGLGPRQRRADPHEGGPLLGPRSSCSQRNRWKSAGSNTASSGAPARPSPDRRRPDRGWYTAASVTSGCRIRMRSMGAVPRFSPSTRIQSPGARRSR